MEPGNSNFFNGSRSRHVTQLWERYLSAGRLEQLDRWLSRTLRSCRAFGKRDRLAYADTLFAIARHSGTAVVLEKAFSNRLSASHIEKAWHDDWPKSEEVWHKSLIEFPSDILFRWIALLSGVQCEANGEFRERRSWWDELRNSPALSVCNVLRAGIPPFCADDLANRAIRSGWTDSESAQFLALLQIRPPLWLRLLDTAKIRDVCFELESKGLSIRKSGAGLAVVGDSSIRALNAYERGWVEIQDKASQAIVENLGVQDGERIWDACTGGGGKAIAIAALLRGNGTVYASDIRGYKLDELNRRAQRAGLNNICTFEADALKSRIWDRAISVQGGFDRVLVDAPCSATGTWRRNPDARWHLSRESVNRLVSLQQSLLESCCAAVRKGGVLAYSTCSWLTAENEDQIGLFLDRHPGWEVLRMTLTGSPREDADTMFVGVLRRTE